MKAPIRLPTLLGDDIVQFRTKRRQAVPNIVHEVLESANTETMLSEILDTVTQEALVDTTPNEFSVTSIGDGEDGFKPFHPLAFLPREDVGFGLVGIEPLCTTHRIVARATAQNGDEESDSRTGSGKDVGTLIRNGTEQIVDQDGITLTQIGQSLGDAIMVHVAFDDELEERVLWLRREGQTPVFNRASFVTQSSADGPAPGSLSGMSRDRPLFAFRRVRVRESSLSSSILTSRCGNGMEMPCSLNASQSAR